MEKAQHERLVELYPSLMGVELLDVQDERFEGGSFELPNEQEEARVYIAGGGPEKFASLKISRETAVRSMAELLGFSFEQMDGETIRAFILLHELGHAFDYQQHFADKDVSGSEQEAVYIWKMNSQDQLQSLPLPGFAPAELREELVAAGSFERWKQMYPREGQRCQELGIHSDAQLIDVQDQAYRQLPKERYADEFAAKTFHQLRKTHN